MNCVICGRPIDPALAPATTHPTCPMFAELGSEDPFTAMVKSQLIDIIRWGEQQNPRGHQVLIGPSEMGSVCDRRIGYKLAEIPECNKDHDEWPATVGTAVHTWLQVAVEQWMMTQPSKEWLTETTLAVNEFIQGHADLYWAKEALVIDWKTTGPDLFKKYIKEGPPPGYVIQAQVYGYGFERAGFPVRKVALVFLNRCGWLKDMYVWVDDYQRSIAETAIARIFKIAQDVVKLDVLKKGYLWEHIPATPSNDCGWCPQYNPGKENGADETGCPGR